MQARKHLGKLTMQAMHDKLLAIAAVHKDHEPLHECMECGVIECPHHEPLHFHHDGCPACD